MLAAGTNPMDALDDAELAPDVDSLVSRALDGAAEMGLVQITEMGLGAIGLWHSLLRIREKNRLPLGVRAYMASGVASKAMPPRTGGDDLEVVGVKFYADGWLGLRTCATNEAFADRPDDHGILFQDALQLARRIEPFATAGWRIATHAIGDRAVDAAVEAYDMVYGADCESHAPRIEHCSLVSDATLQQIAEMGIVVCVQPSFPSSDRHHLEPALGARQRLAFRYNDMIDAGVKLILGSDAPVETIDPLRSLNDVTTTDVVTARLDVKTAFSLMTDQDRGTTLLTGDPRVDGPRNVTVEGTRPSSVS